MSNFALQRHFNTINQIIHMKERIFKMKNFQVRHELSACKVGVDGVMIGAWAGRGSDLDFAMILDAGCGCGIISMMMAQRFPSATVMGIDIDEAALKEAKINVEENGMQENIGILPVDFSDMAEECDDAGVRYDMIVSNPPFFNSGVEIDEKSTPREIARHADSLSPEALIETAPELLHLGGILAFIAPASDEERLIEMAVENDLLLSRRCLVKGNPNVEPKRVMLEFVYDPDDAPEVESETLTIETAPGEYTPEYKELHKDFYLKF